MTKVNPNLTDEELQEAQKSMRGRIDEEEVETMIINGEEVPVSKTTSDEDEKKEEEQNQDDEGKENEEKEEPKREVVKPADDTSDDDNEDADNDDDQESKPPKYHIPVKKYTDEKRSWKEEREKLEQEKADLLKKLEEKDTKINEFTKLTKTKVEEENTKAFDAEVEKFAEKYAMEPEDVKSLLSTLSKNAKPQEQPLAPEMKELLEEFKLNQIKTAFEDEFKTEALPAINDMYPEATPEQIQKIKEALDIDSHLPENNTKELPYLLFKNKATYSKLIEKDAKPEKKTIKGMETSRRIAGDKVHDGLTAADFKGGKTDFSVLNELDTAIANKIVAGFDVETYDAWKIHVSQNEQGVVVQRNGKRVVLK